MKKRQLEALGLIIKRTVANEYGIFTDELYILPLDNDILTASQQSEKPWSAVDNDRNQPCIFGVHFHIIHKPDSAPVLAVYYFLMTQFCNTTAIQKKHLRDYICTEVSDNV